MTRPELDRDKMDRLKSSLQEETSISERIQQLRAELRELEVDSSRAKALRRTIGLLTAADVARTLKD